MIFVSNHQEKSHTNELNVKKLGALCSLDKRILRINKSTRPPGWNMLVTGIAFSVASNNSKKTGKKNQEKKSDLFKACNESRGRLLQ